MVHSREALTHTTELARIEDSVHLSRGWRSVRRLRRGQSDPIGDEYRRAGRSERVGRNSRPSRVGVWTPRILSTGCVVPRRGWRVPMSR